MPARWPATLAVAVWCLVPLSAVQAPADPAFDVASVKPNLSGDPESATFTQPGGRYTATNVTVRSLVKSAYGLHDDQVVGGPGWMNTDRFDITARADGYVSASAFRDAARLMLRPLLADRFKLAMRNERRQLPGYALSLVRADGRLGPKLRCAEIYRPGHMAARGLTLALFALDVSRYTDHVVIDSSGLDGKFDWELQWVPDNPSRDSTSPPAGPSLPAALEEQVGFRLRGQRGSVDVLVVDRLEHPQPD